jgi:hypothetical protein
MTGERVVLDGRLLPDERQQFGFADDPAAVFDQNEEDFEGLRGERRVSMAPPEQALPRVDHVRAELVAARFRRGPVRLHRRPRSISARRSITG